MKVIYDGKNITNMWANCLKYTLIIKVLALTEIKTLSPYTAKIYDFYWMNIENKYK